MYVVIDTNVLVSGLLKPSSNPGLILEMVDDFLITPVYDDEIMEEYIEVLHRPRFHFEEQLIYNTILNLRSAGMTSLKYCGEISEIFNDQSDLKFYLVTLESRKKRDTKLTTGNIKHFPTKPFIVSPKELLEIITK